MAKTIEELQADFDRLTAERDTLSANNQKLVTEKRAALTAAETAQATADAASEKSEREAKDVDALEKRLTAKFQRDIDTATARAEAAEKSLKTMRRDAEIANALAVNDVDAKHHRAATALLKMDMADSEDGSLTIEGKSVADWSKAFFAKDGLSYVRAPNSGGGVAQGSDGAKGIDWTKEAILGAKSREFQMLARDNPAEANAIAERVGLPELKV